MEFDTPVMQHEDDCEISRLEYMGRYVTPSNAGKFEGMVQSVALSGTIDVTGWTVYALHVLLSVCRGDGRTITLRHGNKTFTPIIYSDGSLFDLLLESIATGTL